MTPEQELLEIASKLEASASAYETAEPALSAIEEAVASVARAFSGSWLGYHSRIYYKDFVPVPPGARFSQEWGLDGAFGDMGSRGAWREVEGEQVKRHIYEMAGNPNFSDVRETARKWAQYFNTAKSEIESILTTVLDEGGDPFLERLQDELRALMITTAYDVCRARMPSKQIISRDMDAIGQGFQVPPHVSVEAEIIALRAPFQAAQKAGSVARRAAAHVGRKSKRRVHDARIGTNVFIGHGRSAAWRELKDFVQDRLRLPWDEFNRVPVAGITNISRLAEMLDSAAVAFVIMTAEDELADGEFQARMNVIHEVGLFQGRLGFTKAIVLLEEGCREFSNIQGLGQIRFPTGRISAAFEQVREVLEREGLVT